MHFQRFIVALMDERRWRRLLPVTSSKRLCILSGIEPFDGRV
jgi:hypothetical protein